MVLELLADAPEIDGGRLQPLPTEGTISALNTPHSSIVLDLHQVTEIQAELLGGNGVATEKIKHDNLVSFTCLKSFAFDQRFERKDAHDLIYCIEHAPEGMDAVAENFHKERDGKHGAVIQTVLAILRSRFSQDDKTEGYRKDGPVSMAKFELGESDEPEQREARALRQRQASDVIDQLLVRIGYLLERAGHARQANALEPFVKQAKTAVPLDTAVKSLIESLSGLHEKNARWKLVINEPVEIDF